MRRKLFISWFALILASAACAAAPWDGTPATWVGGTNALGDFTYAELHLRPDLSGSIVVPENEADLPIREATRDGDQLKFSVPSPFGTFHVEMTRSGSVLAGDVITPAGVRRSIHFRRAEPVALDDYAGRFRIGDREIWTMVRPGGLLRLVRSEPVTATILLPLGGDKFADAAKLISTTELDKPIVFERDRRARVVMIRIPGKTATTEARRDGDFTQERVTFGPKGALAGTLILPRSKKPLPAIALLHGSGVVSRDSLLLRAYLFAGAGFATLVFDKRGSGESTGGWRGATFAELAEDGRAAIEYLRGRRDVDSSRIGISGHSQSGWIVPILARKSLVSFAVISSGGAVPPREQEIYRVEAKLKRMGVPANEVAQAKRLMELKWGYAAGTNVWKEYLDSWNAAASKPWFPLVGGARTEDAEEWRAMRAAFDPLADIRGIDVPLLLFFGGKDDLYPSQAGEQLWRETLGDRPPGAVTIVTLPDATHPLVAAGKSTWANGYVDALRRWLADR